MRKKKFLATLMMSTVAMSMLTGCSSNSSNNNSSSSNTTEVTQSAGTSESDHTLTTEPVTLKVWESTEGPDEFIKQAGEAFNKLYPNITVEYVNVELSDTTGQIALDGPAGVGADVFVAPHDKLGELVTGGHVLPTVNAKEIEEKVLSACSTALTYNDTMYGYPVSAETYALFYNKDLIAEDQVPKTWDEVKTFAKSFSKGDQYGFMMNVSDGYYTIIFTTSNNNRIFGPTGTDTTNTNINSEASIKGMELFASLREVLNIPSADLDTAVCDASFSSGKAALYITGLWNVAPFEKAGLNFGVTTLPSLPGNDTPSASFSGTRAMFVSAYTDYPTEAAAFSEFLLTDEMQQLRFELTGALPAIECQVDSPYIPGFLKQLDYAFPMPSIPQMGNYWEAMNAASANIWDGADIKTELDACNAAILK